MNQKRVIDASRGWNEIGRIPMANNTGQSVPRKQPNFPAPKTGNQQVRVTQEPQQRANYVPKQVVRQQPTPNYTVSVNPHANIVYQQPQPQVQQPPVQQAQHQQPQVQQVPQVQQQVSQPVQQVQQPQVQQVQQSTPSIQKRDVKSLSIGYDPDMKSFDLDGCKTIEQVYEKNKHIIKIIPE